MVKNTWTTVSWGDHVTYKWYTPRTHLLSWKKARANVRVHLTWLCLNVALVTQDVYTFSSATGKQARANVLKRSALLCIKWLKCIFIIRRNSKGKNTRWFNLAVCLTKIGDVVSLKSLSLTWRQKMLTSYILVLHLTPSVTISLSHLISSNVSSHLCVVFGLTQVFVPCTLIWP